MGELEAALQALMQFFGGAPPVAGPPSNPAGVAAAGQPGGAGTPGVLENTDLINQLLNLVLAGTGGQYGAKELDQLQQIYAQQQAAARMALGLHPGQLGVQAARMAIPLNKQLQYQVTSAADQNSALSGMSQAPGAVAAGEAGALAPYVQNNLQTGAGLATSADQLALDRLQPSFQLAPPSYSAVLQQLSQLGQGQTFPPYALNNNTGGTWFPGSP